MVEQILNLRMDGHDDELSYVCKQLTSNAILER